MFLDQNGWVINTSLPAFWSTAHRLQGYVGQAGNESQVSCQLRNPGPPY